MAEIDKHQVSEEEKKKIFYPLSELAKNARIKDMAGYRKLYQESIKNMDKFWAKEAEMLTWIKKYDKVWVPPTGKPDAKDDFVGKWFVGGKLNVAYNCCDRWAEKYPNELALAWVGELDEVKKFTYKQITEEVCKAANALKSLGVKKGDRVCIWLPMIPELPITMLACARIGAIHSIVFGGFSADSVKDRVLDSECKILIVADETRRSGKSIPAKATLEGVMDDVKCIEHVIVVKLTGGNVPWKDGRDLWLGDLTAKASATCAPEVMDAEDPLFILYTSGTTGKPKGAVHTTAGFMVYGISTNKYVWDYTCLVDLKGVKPAQRDLFYCTADIGWITGHTQIVYAPLALGAQSLMYEGVPTWPHNGRFWELCSGMNGKIPPVTHFYTAPTALRSLMRYGDEPVKKWDLSHLKMLGTVGEVCNWPEWIWYWLTVGKGTLGAKPTGRPIVDSYWQTETGSYMMVNLGAITPMKPGSCTFPFFGISPVLLDEDGKRITQPNTQGFFCYDKPWPGLMRTVWGQHDRFVDTYFSKFKGHYFTGDYAMLDKDGYWFILGRADDVIKVSGHRLGSAEIEGTINSHPKVAESAVVPVPHDVKGSAVFAFVTLMSGVQSSHELRADIIAHVRKQGGPIMAPDFIMFTDAVPKTRSGKIMRRILKAIATNEPLGNVMTLANPDVVEMLVASRKKFDAEMAEAKAKAPAKK